jgi:hypothetical protein
MDIRVSRLAVTLRWLAVLWMVGWAVYVAFWDAGRLATLEGMAAALAALLIPAILAWVLAWGLDRMPDGRRAKASQGGVPRVARSTDAER